MITGLALHATSLEHEPMHEMISLLFAFATGEKRRTSKNGVVSLDGIDFNSPHT